MKNMKRFLFILLISGFCLLLSSCASIKGEDADVIATGNIFYESEFVEALAIKDGQAVYSGSLDGVIRYLGKDTVLKAYPDDKVTMVKDLLNL